MSKFDGSIAQVNVQFPIETVIEPLAGAAYSRAVIYIPLSQAETYLAGIDSPAVGNAVELTSSNFGALTGGKLKAWLVPFFAKAQSAKITVAIYDDGEEATTHLLSDVYQASKYLGYFKFIVTETDAYNAAQLALSNLCVADPLYSALWIGTSDNNVLSGTSALISSLNEANSNARVIFHPDTNINPALAQLGASLAAINVSGTPVGNSIDMIAFNTIDASGTTAEDEERNDLSATEKAALDGQKIGYVTWVGDGTENVVVEGSLTLKGDSVGANWVKHYIEYMAKVRTANLITRMNTFRNNATYQAILAVLSDIVQDFVTFGRLDGFRITAPVFSDLPATGDQITVPNAWRATYIDNVREVAVYGTLYLTQPTR